MRANWLGGKSKAQSSYPEHSRLAPITSRTLGSPATPVALTSIHPVRLRSSARKSCRVSHAPRFPAQTLLKWRMRSYRAWTCLLESVPSASTSIQQMTEQSWSTASPTESGRNFFATWVSVIYCVQVQLRRKGRRNHHDSVAQALLISRFTRRKLLLNNRARFVARDAPVCGSMPVGEFL